MALMLNFVISKQDFEDCTVEKMHHQSAKDFFSQREILIYLSSYPSSISFFPVFQTLT